MAGLEGALACGLLTVAGNKLCSLISSEFASITGLKKDLSELQDIHTKIMSWLSMVRGRTIDHEASGRGVMKLRSLANEIYDLLDDVYIQDEKHKVNSDHDKPAITDNFSAKPELLLFQQKVAHKIDEIKVTFDTIVMENTLHNLQVDQSVQSRNKETSDHSLLRNVEDLKIPSRDHVKGNIISKLVQSNKGECNHIVSIVGLGGSGKTTLAQHICHDDKIKEHFTNTIFWVHVSQEFCKDKLIGKLFEAVVEQNSGVHAQDQMLHAISNKLGGKKFLLVLDDAWHEDRQEWENFKVILNNGACGSKILLTTRNQSVAEAVESEDVFKLPFFLEDESWSLFLNSCGWVEQDLDSSYIQVGKDIVKKCGGVPLAIKTLGSVLHEKRTINTWRAIRENNLWEEENIEGRVFASLTLSYIYLKDHLKECFTFCSIFPKGYKINKDYLIEQWIAHGFIKLKNEDLAHDIGNEYFDALMKAGFLQSPVQTWPEKSVVCEMHDLIHDLTRYILQYEVMTSLPKNMTTHNWSQKCRYLSLMSCSEKVEGDLFDKVRAVYVSGGNPSLDNHEICYIRSVVLDYVIDTLFPQFILKLEHLGYLEIHHLRCTELPEAISGCWNLQSLHFISCKGFVMLPMSIGKLKKLRTLELNDITDLESLPESIGDCQDLQFLQLNYCGKLRDIPSSMGRLGNLRVLHILRCSSLQLPSEFNGELRNLQTLNLHACLGLQDLPSTFACPILRTLHLSETKVTVLPQWVTSIGTLEHIDLHNCKELVELPKGIANLKNLEVLNLVGCSKLQCMPSGFGQLTLLRHLALFAVGCGRDDARISELENLDMISGNMEITNLKYLKDPSEAEKAMLKRKNIWRLKLTWSSSQTEEEIVSDMEQDQGVLNALEPSSQIKDLKICGYRGSILPCWMTKLNDSSFCAGIVFKQASLCQFLSLTEMTLEEFPHLKYIRGLQEFPSLKFLSLVKMPNLEELWTTTTSFEIQGEESEPQHCFPVLSEVCITGCPKLIVKPYFPPSLVTLSFEESNEQLLSLGSFSHPLPPPANESSSSFNVHSAAPCLRELRLRKMMGSSSNWELLQSHTELETLHIECCNDLKQLPDNIRNLTSLRVLCIQGCLNLTMLPEWLGELRSLQFLFFFMTPMLHSLPESTKHLTSLTSLQICRWDEMKQLPDVIQHLTSLELLNLVLCHALTELPEWIGQLSALRTLKIQLCPGLQCLPQSLQRLTALRELHIGGCPGLLSRYKQGVGPDWQLISHIPNIRMY